VTRRRYATIEDVDRAKREIIAWIFALMVVVASIAALLVLYIRETVEQEEPVLLSTLPPEPPVTREQVIDALGLKKEDKK
jgi:hypothetical protein